MEIESTIASRLIDKFQMECVQLVNMLVIKYDNGDRLGLAPKHTSSSLTLTDTSDDISTQVNFLNILIVRRSV
jgi:hypothetical protein